MKFEIDDKTGMIRNLYVDLNHLIIGDDSINSTELEVILQAVKKIQAKLVNKQIQNIQDSKKEYTIHQTDETKKLYKQQKDKIEQNQVKVNRVRDVIIDHGFQNITADKAMSEMQEIIGIKVGKNEPIKPLHFFLEKSST